MSELHELCLLKTRPIDNSYYEKLKQYLKAGIPATYTLEEAVAYEQEDEGSELKSTTTPLHILSKSIPLDVTDEESKIVLSLIDELFSWGAGWNLVDDEKNTPGDVLYNRFGRNEFYERVVDAGVRAEILLRKINDDIEFISDPEEAGDEDRLEIQETFVKEEPSIQDEAPDDLQTPAGNQSIYLNTKLEYKDNALVTKDTKDGVMMDWERTLMEAGCQSIFKSAVDPETDKTDTEEISILNIGFGMGIIDTLIQEQSPQKHYISEAHPDVLAKLRQDGWYEKPNVVILEGRWQDTLPALLSKGVFFNGIYYDTFSEHYSDMLELYDIIVGLLKPSGVFSFFNGLGADRQVTYDVYKKIVELDLNNYGMDVKFKELSAPELTLKESDEKEESVWNDINRPYWRCKQYYHPEIRFF